MDYLVAITLFFASPSLNELISGSTDPELISNASLYNRISSSFYPVLAVLLVLRNSLQGLGQKITPLISSFIELFGKILFVLFIIPSTGYMGVIFCEPLIWVPMTIQLYYSYKHQPIIQSLKKRIVFLRRDAFFYYYFLYSFNVFFSISTLLLLN